jgi:hypothetical protein
MAEKFKMAARNESANFNVIVNQLKFWISNEPLNKKINFKMEDKFKMAASTTFLYFVLYLSKFFTVFKK